MNECFHGVCTVVFDLNFYKSWGMAEFHDWTSWSVSSLWDCRITFLWHFSRKHTAVKKTSVGMTFGGLASVAQPSLRFTQAWQSSWSQRSLLNLLCSTRLSWPRFDSFCQSDVAKATRLCIFGCIRACIRRLTTSARHKNKLSSTWCSVFSSHNFWFQDC